MCRTTHNRPFANAGNAGMDSCRQFGDRLSTVSVLALQETVRITLNVTMIKSMLAYVCLATDAASRSHVTSHAVLVAMRHTCPLLHLLCSNFCSSVAA